MILVTGATGNIGSALAKMLVEAGHEVRCLSRDMSKARAVLGNDLNVVVGDLERPETLLGALVNVEKAFFVSHAGPKLADLAGSFFDVAKAAGVRHVVAVSSATIAIEPSVAIGRWHLALEERLKASGLSWTMLRPGNFASNALRWAPMIRAQGAVYAPQGDGRSAPIDPRDIAAVAFAALTTTGHAGKTYVLTGSEILSVREQVEKIRKALGKPLRFVAVPEERARAQMLASGTPAMMVDAIMELVGEGTRPSGGYKTTTVRDVTGRKPRTFDDWVRDNVAAFS
jgi:uncharacterized protein YbjT (DUF2867 family)